MIKATAALWQYDPNSKRFRETRTGQFIGKERLRAEKEFYQVRQKERVNQLARRMVDGELTLPQWQSEMRQLLKESHLTMYSVGKGGRQRLNQRDYGRIGASLKKQYRYLDQWAQKIHDEGIEADDLDGVIQRLSQRGNLYIEAANASYWQGLESEWGIELPFYPGDGSSECLVNCRCHWNIKEEQGRIYATWELDASEHCPTCLQRSNEWNRKRLR